METNGNFMNLELSHEEGTILSMENRAFYDAEIKATIFRTLTWYSRAPLENINISVKRGYVTLSGTVPFLYQKMVIVSTVQCSKGVKGIYNNIEVTNSLAALVEV